MSFDPHTLFNIKIPLKEIRLNETRFMGRRAPELKAPKPRASELTAPEPIMLNEVEYLPKSRDSIPVFLTPQAFAAFPVATGAVTITWKVLGKLFPQWGASGVVLLIIAFLAGALIYTISTTDQMTQKDKMIGVIIAIFNSFFLAASALGIDVATG